MKYQLQRKPAGRRQPWTDVEVVEIPPDEAVALIRGRSLSDGRPWRFFEVEGVAAALRE